MGAYGSPELGAFAEYRNRKACKYCKSEIPKAATVCGYCRKRQRNNIGLYIGKLLVVIVFGVIVISLVLAKATLELKIVWGLIGASIISAHSKKIG